jgi:methylenetetrahydrofolate dehydrogenase (NADP+) / methenyltetrahydrofolate cyclohydrolase
VSRQEVLDLLAELNADPAVDGYLVQLPVPGTSTPASFSWPSTRPRTPMASTRSTSAAWPSASPGPGRVPLLGSRSCWWRYDVPISGAHVVILGRGTTVGRPLAMLLSLKEPNANATVIQVHTGTRNVAELTRQADILVAATGRPGLVTAGMVKPGAAVLDVGITRTDAGLVGDVAPEVAEVAGWLAPIPGGVGPMTVALLLRNAVEAAERRAARNSTAS